MRFCRAQNVNSVPTFRNFHSTLRKIQKSAVLIGAAVEAWIILDSHFGQSYLISHNILGFFLFFFRDMTLFRSTVTKDSAGNVKRFSAWLSYTTRPNILSIYVNIFCPLLKIDSSACGFFLEITFQNTDTLIMTGKIQYDVTQVVYHYNWSFNQIVCDRSRFTESILSLTFLWCVSLFYKVGEVFKGIVALMVYTLTI